MADGYIIEINSPRLVNGRALRQIWYAHIPDRKRAIQAVRRAARADKTMTIDIVRPERHKILLERMALLEGEVRPE